MKMKISCKEAAGICDKAQYKEASLIEKIKLKYHLAFCKFCSEYTKQNNMLTRLLKGKVEGCANVNFQLDDDAKNKFKEALKNKD